MGFFDKLEARMKARDSMLCLGLDPRVEELDKFAATGRFRELLQETLKEDPNPYSSDPDSRYLRLKLYCLHIFEHTLDHVCCVKPNFAFFLAHSTEGIQVLLELCQLLRRLEVPVLLDCKLGDIGSTTQYYRKFIFEELRADACTVNTLMGTDVLKALCCDSAGRLVNDVFVLAKCSNASSSELQGALLADSTPVYLRLIEHSQSLLSPGEEHFGYVVGATCVEVIQRIRERCESWLLVPGVGSQGGDLERTVKFGLNKRKRGLLVPISRAITDTEDPGRSAEFWKNEINRHVMSYS